MSFTNITSSNERQFNFPDATIPYCFVQNNWENIAFQVEAEQYDIQRNMSITTRAPMPHLVKMDIGDAEQSPFFELCAALKIHFNTALPVEFHCNKWVYLKVNEYVLKQLETLTCSGNMPILTFDILVKHVIRTPGVAYRVKCVLTGVHPITPEQRNAKLLCKQLTAQRKAAATMEAPSEVPNPGKKVARNTAAKRKGEPIASKKMKRVNAEGAEVDGPQVSTVDLDAQLQEIYAASIASESLPTFLG
jgi:hypothetical protein